MRALSFWQGLAYMLVAVAVVAIPIAIAAVALQALTLTTHLVNAQIHPVVGPGNKIARQEASAVRHLAIWAPDKSHSATSKPHSLLWLFYFLIAPIVLTDKTYTILLLICTYEKIFTTPSTPFVLLAISTAISASSGLIIPIM